MVSYCVSKLLRQQVLIVLILIVVDNGLVPILILLTKLFQDVLILIVVDNGLVPHAVYKLG